MFCGLLNAVKDVWFWLHVAQSRDQEKQQKNARQKKKKETIMGLELGIARFCTPNIPLGVLANNK